MFTFVYVYTNTYIHTQSPMSGFGPLHPGEGMVAMGGEDTGGLRSPYAGMGVGGE